MKEITLTLTEKEAEDLKNLLTDHFEEKIRHVDDGNLENIFRKLDKKINKYE